MKTYHATVQVEIEALDEHAARDILSAVEHFTDKVDGVVYSSYSDVELQEEG